MPLGAMLVVLQAVVLMGCGPGPGPVAVPPSPPPPAPTQTGTTVPLPTHDGSRDQAMLATVGGYLATDGPQAGRCVWLQFERTQSAVLWPPGYRARFDPKVQILAADGTVQAREGDWVEIRAAPAQGARGSCLIGQRVYKAYEVRARPPRP